MNNVIHMEDYLPHLCIQDEDGNAHVLPVSLVEDWATNRRSLPGRSDPDNQKVVRAILREFLSYKCGVDCDGNFEDDSPQ